MTDERITEVETPSGNTHTTIVTDGERTTGGGGSTLLIVLVLVVLAGIALYFFSGMSKSESNKDNAVAAAADNVSEAADKVGHAAQDAAKKVVN